MKRHAVSNHTSNAISASGLSSPASLLEAMRWLQEVARRRARQREWGTSRVELVWEDGVVKRLRYLDEQTVEIPGKKNSS